MTGGLSASGAAEPLPCRVPFLPKLKFLCLHVFCALFVDLVLRLTRFFSRAQLRTEATATHGSLQAKSFFKLDRLDKVPYADPPYSGHVSTILCAFRPHRSIPYQRVVHPGADGNPMYLDWLLTDSRHAKGVFLIIPGLASWSGTNYIEHFVWFAFTHHFHCGVFNSRGMGNTPIETPRLMSGKWTDDLRAVLRDGPFSRAAIEKHCGAGIPIIAVGFSLGGVILSKYVGEECLAARELVMDAVMVVNSPLDCLDSNAVMNRRISKLLYQPSMAGGLTAYARRHAKVLKDLPGLSPDVRATFASGRLEKVLAQVKTVRDFDRFITAPTLGFATPEDYYHHISPIEWLPHFSVPVLCISAADDPVTGEPPMASLANTMQSNPNVALLVIPHGGHLGYIRSVWDEWLGTETVMEKIIYEVAAAITPRR
ncbi:Alpha/beta hydrolase family/alpha/beta hydrolase fold, putative [Leishmania donovani]|uniref:Alpha/beta hydrolase family/alpha/beta hydrolase fold, putative n=1 Tax=Leishmania donovani TaxID=5661 RepID=A0A3S7X2V6_LEIDO|nr:Alpha/beta hydrolase family/alpha/beta hydrolase fold, putative [Leishmania donovani]